jgi:hypothetical protein
MIAKRKVVILLGSPFTEQNYERIGIPYLAPHFEILVLDCAVLIGRCPDAITFGLAKWDRYFSVETYSELKQALITFGPVFALDDIGLGLETRSVVNILRQCNVRLVALKTGVVPSLTLWDKFCSLVRQSRVNNNVEVDLLGQKTLARIELRAGRLNQLKKMFLHIVGKVKREVWDRPRFPGPAVSLVAGSHAFDWIARKSKNILWVGSEDYHVFKTAERQLQSGALHKRAYAFALFLDVCLPLANDWKFLNHPPPISAEKYYPLLCGFLEKMETELSMPVIVAGHPNSKSIPNYSKLIGGRDVVFGQTAALVQQCNVVLTHASTATSFAVLARKPILFVTSDQLGKSDYGDSIKAMAETLGCGVLSLECGPLLSRGANGIAVDELRYARYEQSFLKNHQSNETRPWGAFIEYATADEID